MISVPGHYLCQKLEALPCTELQGTDSSCTGAHRNAAKALSSRLMASRDSVGENRREGVRKRRRLVLSQGAWLRGRPRFYAAKRCRLRPARLGRSWRDIRGCHENSRRSESLGIGFPFASCAIAFCRGSNRAGQRKYCYYVALRQIRRLAKNAWSLSANERSQGRRHSRPRFADRLGSPCVAPRLGNTSRRYRRILVR